jgi:hypothetical protein
LVERFRTKPVINAAANVRHLNTAKFSRIGKKQAEVSFQPDYRPAITGQTPIAGTGNYRTGHSEVNRKTLASIYPENKVFPASFEPGNNTATKQFVKIGSIKSLESFFPKRLYSDNPPSGNQGFKLPPDSLDFRKLRHSTAPYLPRLYRL